VILAQALAPPDSFLWSAFAPELLAAAGALTLMMLAVGGRRRMIVAIPIGLVAVALGAFLISRDLVVPGAVTVAFGAGVVALPVGFAAAPPLMHVALAWWTALGSLVLTLWQAFVPMQYGDGTLIATEAMGGSIAMDGIALFTRITVYVTVLFVLPLGHAYLRDREIHRPEFEPLLLLSAIGMTLLGAANDLITVFVTLEILSIALYVMAGMARRDRRSQEAAIKYFVMGAVASAILLYGMALIYVAVGSLDVPSIGLAVGLTTTPQRVVAIGLILMTVGLGFKVALVPFHTWTPDVYEGAPTNVTAFMAAGTKAAAFAALLRLYLLSFGSLSDYWVPVIAVLAAVTMIYGAVVALVQRDVKRILAYSALAHAGYAAIGVASANRAGLSATLWYLLTYAISTLAAFGVVLAIERTNRRAVALVDLRGLGRTSPFLAGILSIALLSLAGLPPTVGFVGKLTVFEAGLQAGLAWLVVVGVISSVIAAFFYLRLMGMMFLEDPDESADEPLYAGGWGFAVNVAAILVLFLGIQPSFLLDLAEASAILVR
jgi:NADH-quinone oxidoreductase subunit N